MGRTIWVLAVVIVAAFVVGILSANPVVEAVGGWKAAVIELNDDISDIELFLEDKSDFWEFLEEGGSELFGFDLVSVENQGICEDGQVVKRDSDLASSPTGWSCQPDETGDGGGGTPGDPLDEIKLIPQPESTPPPSMCSASTAGTIYYKLTSVDEPDQVCVCADRDGQGIYQYTDLLSDGIC
jgi:hypothetical protein